jgi:hypothetical protein
MTNIDFQRKAWNKQHKELRRLLESGENHEQAIELFYAQHAPLHAAQVYDTDGWTFEEEVFKDLTEEQARRIPKTSDNSIVWCLWHLARIEDITMNMLVAGRPQLADSEGWFEKLGAAARDTGNAMSKEEIAALNVEIDIQALRAYRMAAGRRTREIVGEISPEALKEKVDPARLQKVLDEGALVEEAAGLAKYWGNRTIAGLLLMPPTRHCMVHLNEALQLKKKK